MNLLALLCPEPVGPGFRRIGTPAGCETAGTQKQGVEALTAVSTPLYVAPELRELGEAIRHCQASYARTFTSLPHRAVIARYYQRLNRLASGLSAR